ncbi:hypothetical protein [Streptococcus orisratti]
MTLVFDEQLSLLEKPKRENISDDEYELYEKNVEFMEQNWGFSNNLFKVLPLNSSQYKAFLDFKPKFSK